MTDTTTEIMIAQEYTPKQRMDSKLILQNMEDVLHTVKKKHREKHRRKKEQKKLDILEGSQIAATAEAMATAMTANSGKSMKNLEEEEAEKRSKNVKKSKINELDKMIQVIVNNEHEIDKNDDEDKGAYSTPRNSITNAFEIMMSARNRSIGSNSSGGKEMITSPPLTNESNKSPPLNQKNKMKLQELAEKVGGGKRRLDEEAREAYINHTLKRRVKRFKKMLMNGSTPNDNVKLNLKESNQVTAIVVSECSEDKDNDLTVEVASLDSETEEFLAKLNSPTKKADTLLGYFPKVQSLEATCKKETAEIKNVEKTSRRVRQRHKLENVENVKNVKEEEEKILRKRMGRSSQTMEKTLCNATETNRENERQTTSISGVDKSVTNRARRSCAVRVRYDFDLETSPTKLVRKFNAKNKKKSTPMKFHQSDELVIDLDDSSTISSISLVSPKKFAPIFARNSNRSIPKPISDPEIAKARKAFLASGVPEKLRIEQEKQKLHEQHYEDSVNLFPKITHVRQLSEKDLIREALPVTVSYKLRDLEQLAIATSNTCPKNRKDKAIAATTAKQSLLLKNLTDCDVKDIQTKLYHKYSAKSKASRSQTKVDIQIPLPTLLNKREIIKHWKTDFGRFPTYKCYNQMREKYRHFNDMDATQNTEQVSESFMVIRGNRRSLKTNQRKSKNAANDMDDDGDDDDNDDDYNDYKPPITAPNGELLFTEKYKPLLYEQVLVNLNPVIQLKQFLSNWSTTTITTTTSPSSTTSASSFHTNLKRTLKNGFMHDFASDNDSNSNSSSSQQTLFANAIVLMGPIASGKTSSVFALANDMNFNVLEINAGMKRTGKRLIQELQEATQSHQIRQEASPGSNLLLNCKQKQLIELSMNGLKVNAKTKNKIKRKSKANINKLNVHRSTINVEQQIIINNDGMEQSEESLLNESSLTSRKCLILIEDADIVFDQMDAGFIDAIYSLTASSKRPVILVASNPNCNHLQRLLMQNNCIQFYVPTVLNIVKFLAILSLIENCPIYMDDLISLYLYNRKDLRKTLLELQFFIQSGGDYHRYHHLHHHHHHNRQQLHEKGTFAYYASPRKRQFSIEQSETPKNVADGSDGTSQSYDVNIEQKTQISYYTHNTLFDFFTMNQNVKWRIPYPVDFELLSINVNDLIQVAMQNAINTGDIDKSLSTISLKLSRSQSRSQSRSPKKQWLNNATQMSNGQNFTLKHFKNFYENLSVAEYINRNKNKRTFQLPYENENDRLLHSPNDDIIHCLVEKAIEINLNVEYNSYNLYVASNESFSLCKEFSVNCTNARHLDYEPCLRAICRWEKLRCDRERRSTRFYHYLRNYISNLNDLSTESLDQACHIFQEPSISSFINLDT